MSIKSLRADAEASFDAAKLKVETTYCELVEAGEKASNDLEKKYLDAIDELNAARAEVAELAKKFKAFMKAYGKKIVIGGLIVIAILSVGYISGFFAA